MNSNWKLGVVVAGICFASANAPVAHAQNETLPNASAPDAIVSAPTLQNSESSTRTLGDWVTVRLNLKAGDKYRVTQTSETKSVSIWPAQGQTAAQKIESLNTVRGIVNYDVLYFNADGTAQVRLTYGDMSNRITAMKLNGKAMPLPRRQNAQDNMLKGLLLEMKVSSSGQVSDVRGLDKFWKKMFAQSGAAQMPPAEQRQMQAAMKKMLGDNFIKKVFQQSGMQYPENPVRIGGSWIYRVETDGQLPLASNVRRTLQSRENGALTISDSGALAIGDAKKTVAFGPVNFKVAVTGNYSGTSVLDETSGFVRSANFTHRFSGTVRGDKSAQSGTPAQKITLRIYELATTKAVAEKIS